MRKPSYNRVLITQQYQDDPQLASTTDQYQDNVYNERVITWSFDKSPDSSTLAVSGNAHHLKIEVREVKGNRIYRRSISIEKEHVGPLIEYLQQLQNQMK